MSDPFAWMVGQVKAAVAAQEPAGAVALGTGTRSVISAIKELGPVTAGQLAQRAHIANHMACQRLYKAERAGVVRVVGKRSWQGRAVNLYDLSGDWR